MFLIKKKFEKIGLEKAVELNLITKKEYLELNLKRAEKELEEFTKIKPVKVKIRNVK